MRPVSATSWFPLLVVAILMVLTASGWALLKAVIPVSGDIDHSGGVNALDIQLVINAALGIDIDVDDDGLSDAAEVNLLSNPTSSDSDNDGAADFQEYAAGTLEPVAGTIALASVQFWAYQIQSVTDPGAVAAMAASRYDMLVIDPTRTDLSTTETAAFDTPGAVTTLKNSLAHDGQHKKLVIAYIDIGQAEDWRWYWTWSANWTPGNPFPSDWPDYIVAPDPDGWAGNYPVAYWDSQWKDIVIYGVANSGQPYNSILDEVIQSGFDGVYLDWVEGFENEQVIAAATTAGQNPEQAMLDFIAEMRQYATNRGRPDFIIIQQNASALINEIAAAPQYIDAIAQEGIWFDGEATDNWDDPLGYDATTPAQWTGEYLTQLDAYRTAGIPVFCCEYALQNAAQAYSLAQQKSYIPYVTRRSLGNLTTTPPPGY